MGSKLAMPRPIGLRRPTAHKSAPKRILLKVTGMIFVSPDGRPTAVQARAFGKQIATLKKTHHIGIVIGGGNLFRGSQHGATLGITPAVGHHVGMLATLMNGLMLQDLLAQQGITSTVLSALPCSSVGVCLSPQEITRALERDDVLIFVGGTGAPYVTTDTNAVIRALQMGAPQVWKCTDVDGVYNADPKKDPHATKLASLTYEKALALKLGVIDHTALTIAQQNSIAIRVIPLFEHDALVRAMRDEQFGSLIFNRE
jgi:uridylate kinase